MPKTKTKSPKLKNAPCKGRVSRKKTFIKGYDLPSRMHFFYLDTAVKDFQYKIIGGGLVAAAKAGKLG